MEPGGGTFSYCLSLARAPGAGGRQAEARAAELQPAASCWRRSPSDSALARGVGRRPSSALAPSSNLKIFLDRDLSKERHELLKDQRQFHNQARKHFLETNKRRRALEEKWKEEEKKELKLREQILQERKLKNQEATERFQRGHLPYAQRKRVQRRIVPKLDEAFEKIQVTGLQLPLYRGNGGTTNMASLVAKNGSSQWKQNTAKIGGDRVMEGNDRASLGRDQFHFQPNLEEMQQQLHEQHFSNLQSFHQEVNEIANSESTGSIDSLQADEQIESSVTPSETPVSAQLDSKLYNSQESQSRNKSLSDYTNTTISNNQHVNNWLMNINTSDLQRTSPFRDILIKYNVLTPEELACDPDQKPSLSSTSEQKESEKCTPDDNLAIVQNKRSDKYSLLKNPSLGTASTEDPLATDKPALKFSKAWATPAPSLAALVQEKNSEILQNNRTSLAQTPNLTVATRLVFPTGQRSSTSTVNNSVLVNCSQKGKDTQAARCHEDADCVTGAETEDCCNHINNEASLSEETCKSHLDQQNDNRKGRVSETVLSVPCGDFAASLPDHDHRWNNRTNERKGVKLPKSILKKESKYESTSHFKALIINRGIRFGNQSVPVIRDSVELAKTKGKDVDNQRNCKKLRWFDEINRIEETNDDEKCSEQSITEIPQAPSQSSVFPIKATTSRTNLRSIPSCTIDPAFLEDQQGNSQTSIKLAASGGAEGDNESLNPSASAGYHIAKQAWMASKGEEINPPPCIVDLNNPKSNPHKGRVKIIKRPKSAKVPSTFGPRNRKGTIIRPQSASEVTSVVKAQGKVMVPHPPYKSVTDKRTDQNDSSLVNEGQDLNRDTTEGPSPQSIICNSHLGTGGPSEPSPGAVTHDPSTKTSHMANTAQSISQPNSAIKRSPAYSDSGFCLNHTSADDEIKPLLQGVHSVLIQKNGAAGDSKHFPVHHNNSSSGDVQPTRSSVPHITIDGGNLIKPVKPGARVNGFFSSQPSSAVTRRKQNNDHYETKRKALLEQRRQMAGSAGWKPSYLGQNSLQALKLGPSQSASEPVHAMGGVGHSDEVSDSTTQFLLAENLANTAATESEILTYLDTAHPYKPTVGLNRSLRPGISALSLEEHKVLQSLDRLNQRLQNIQETMNKNPSCSSILETISPMVFSSSNVDIMPSVQRCKSILADARTLTQRKY